MATSPDTKECTLCKTVKPISDFGRHKITKDGLNYQCKICNRERVKAYQAAGGEAFRQKKHEYDKQRYAEGYNRDNTAWRRANREYCNLKSREWYAANREKGRASKQNYKHRRRLKEGAGMTWAELAAWKRDQPKVCYWCSKRCPRSYHVDHYIPLSKGGRHEPGNLVIACGPCNLRKSAKDPLDFAREVGRLL